MEPLPERLLAISIRIVRARAAYQRSQEKRFARDYQTALREFRQLVPSVSAHDATRLAAVLVDLAGTKLRQELGLMG